MQQPNIEQPPVPRMSRFLRLLVGDGETGPSRPGRAGTDAPTAERVAALEDRIEQLEHGVHLIADTLRRSHADLSREVRSLRAGSQESDRVTRAEVQRMLWEALGPLASAVERLNESVRSLPLVVNASAERLLERASRPNGEDTPPVDDSIPVRPFELEPLDQSPSEP